MSLDSQIANTIAAALTFTAEGEEPIVLGEARALRIGRSIADLLWTLAAPTLWEGRRGRSLFMERGSE